MSTATSAVVIPDLIGSGLWGGIQALLGALWPAMVLAIALTLFLGMVGLVVGLVRRGAHDLR